MENASKALIIAGAILLSILIIALGIYVFNLARTSMNTDQLDTMSASTFNAQFTNYEGKQQGTQVKVLLDNVISNITKNKDAEERLPDIAYSTTSGGALTTITSTAGDDTKTNVAAISELRNKNIANSHTYTVTITKDSGTGLVKLIEIVY